MRRPWFDQMLKEIRAEREAEIRSGPLAILGLAPGASAEEITRAYREQAKRAHPDAGGSAEAFRAVRAAYEELRG